RAEQRYRETVDLVRLGAVEARLHDLGDEIAARLEVGAFMWSHGRGVKDVLGIEPARRAHKDPSGPDRYERSRLLVDRPAAYSQDRLGSPAAHVQAAVVGA